MFNLFKLFYKKLQIFKQLFSYKHKIPNTFLFLSTFSIKFLLCSSRKDTLHLCDFTVPKSPIYNAVQLYHSGLNQSECVLKMKLFRWSVGLYCTRSGFCGLGLDQSSDWRSFISSAVEPVREVCQVIIDLSKNSCHSFKRTLFHIGIMRGIILNINQTAFINIGKFTNLGSSPICWLI